MESSSHRVGVALIHHYPASRAGTPVLAPGPHEPRLECWCRPGTSWLLCGCDDPEWHQFEDWQRPQLLR